MEADKIKLIVTYTVAACLAIGGAFMAAWAWIQPPVDPPRDLSILFGVIGLVIGSSTTFLFGAENSTRATRAAQSSTASGAANASPQPNVIAPRPPSPVPAAEFTYTTTRSDPDDE